ncbi:MAG TPA: inositol monophosphatase family protein [Candidatus Limnocylindrales bacterium]|nr:inositol monophosphatase family protein [Candidatus Limnocylindrales bacterium]
MNELRPMTLLPFVDRLLDSTDELLLEHFGRPVPTTLKADATPVTAADTAVEERLRAALAEALPGHGFLGEEMGVEAGTTEARWIIDPIDGTYNFARGIPIFATLVAYELEGELVLGAVSAPALGRRWSAVRGAGARLRFNRRERPINVSSVDRLEDAQLCHSSMRDLAEAGLLGGWQAMVARGGRDRGFGDFWGHMMVAEGSAEAAVEYGVRAWDLAALKVIVSEAGGRLTDLEGGESWSGPGVLTSNGRLHERLLTALRGE